MRTLYHVIWKYLHTGTEIVKGIDTENGHNQMNTQTFGEEIENRHRHELMQCGC